MRHLGLILALTSAMQITTAFAAAWPDNWLGAPDPGFVTLNIGVFYYGAVINDFPDADGNAAFQGEGADWLNALAFLPEQDQAHKDAELERIRWEMDEAARFYWRNTRFNLALDYDWHFEEQPIMRSSIASSEGPYHSPVDHPAYGDMRREYDGLVQIMVLYKYDVESSTLKRVRGGGGFTWGLDAETMECGWSWWSAPPADNACGSDWLMVHEFCHQVDSMFDESGHPEVWFNHLSPSEGNVARFGEHFDANAYILRRIPEADWGDLLWGSYDSFGDLDEDNVPDYSDYLETLGLVTDPDHESSDADGDGMSDFDEFMASNGNRNGHGERLHPALKLCDPMKVDTDGDRLADEKDALPMYPFPNSIPRVSDDQRVHSSLQDDLWQGLGSHYHIAEECVYPTRIHVPTAEGMPGLSVDLYYEGSNSWEDEITPGSLVIKVFALKEELDVASYDIKVMLDLNNDGWFTGEDNYQIMIADGEISKVLQHGTTSSIEWPQPKLLDINSLNLINKPARSDPREDKDTKAKLDIVAELFPNISRDPNEMVIHLYPKELRLVISQEHFPELAAKPGEMIGFNIGVKRPGESWYYMVGEPNTLIPFELR